MEVAQKLPPKKKIKDWVFKQVHTNNLVYNTCWEDPRCDRHLLDIQSGSKIVMITSAGCNALDYALDTPNEIHCVDMNPRQNALLELKKSVFASGDFDSLFQLFGKGSFRHAKTVYKSKLAELLPDFARGYWDKNIRYFDGKGVKRTFYHCGTAGTFAWFANRYFKLHKLTFILQDFLNAQTLEEQADIYQKIEDKALGGFVEWIVNRHLTMTLLGVPRSQQELFTHKYTDGAMGFIKECLRHIFTELPIRDNYFWRLYINGEYTMSCCPEYLKAENFETLQEQHQKITTHNMTISQFLQENPDTYSHFVLLDHQDWLASNDHHALEEEWRLILENSASGTKILLRSASHEVDFFPDFVKEQVDFSAIDTAEQHYLDRVGTYASVYVGVVK